MNHHTTALIVGGGVIGGAVAWELSKLGMDCTIVDKGAFCAEASTASAGMLCPQAEIFDASTDTDLFLQSQAIHREWTEELEESSHIPVGYVKKGMFRVSFTENDKLIAKRKLSGLSTTSIEWLDSQEILNVEPDISSEICGGISFPEDGQLHPIYLARSLYTALYHKNCKIIEGTPVLSLLKKDDKVIGVHTASGDYFADYTIVAAGAWSSSLLSSTGFHMPVSPVKGQLYAVRNPSMRLEHTVQGPGGVVIPRLDGTFTIGVTHEEVGFDKRPTVEGISQVHKGVTQFVPDLKDAVFAKTWAGLRPGTQDGLPYIGAVSGVEGVYVATGHYTIGILLAPITGKLIAQMITNGEPIVDIKRFRPERFDVSFERKSR